MKKCIKIMLLGMLFTIIIVNLAYADAPYLLYNDDFEETALQLTGSDTASQKFTSYKDFNCIEVQCPSWSNNTGNLTLKLYRWNKDYSTTINSAPIEVKYFIDFKDNEWLSLKLSTQNSGEYLWELSNPTEIVGVWRKNGNLGNNTAYLNGKETEGEYKARIYFTTKATDLYDPNSTFTPVELTGGKNTAASKIFATDKFKSVEVFCPSWNNAIGNLTLKLYKWSSDYYTTINSEPIASKAFVNFQDNSWLTLNFDSQQAGYYLWVLSNGDETVGVWKHLNSTGLNITYFNGEEINGDYKSRIYYDDYENQNPSVTPSNDGIKICGYVKSDVAGSINGPEHTNEGFKVEIPELNVWVKTRENGYFEIYNVPVSVASRTLVISKESYLKRTIDILSVSKDTQLSTKEAPIKICPGDIVQDNAINMMDVIEIASLFNTFEGSENYRCDLDRNGVINIEDFLIIAKHFNKCSEDYFTENDLSYIEL
ncbi:dockerin type I domain-containing protein [Pseudobacteroides cellulosolvens]|uniref:Dockerin domain-containing protein n=1 Tax=Pseudobacteroides cellulosolvens ATCC 35603 = DSM 2933 TaxID=398512 RepID=A0A0L6JV91_9FIRM|nr:dockerin type I domain-containing protein [Pseudobacteroides cellulosolvens]KNY29649.1 hypothetical protein Bccel_4923 [Pseudobacteroides cellulosolvens ATCC 35603 = DSM 2933]